MSRTSDSFMISSGTVSGNPQKYVEALRNAASSLREISAKSKIQVYAMYSIDSYLGDLYSSDDEVLLLVEYWRLSKSEINEHERDYKEWKEKNMLDAPKLKELLRILPAKKGDIGMVEQRLPNAGFPVDASQLLINTAQTIENLNNIEVIDLVYQDYKDADNNQHPSIRFYYIDKESVKGTFIYKA